MQRSFLYADNAATTPLSPKALQAMLPYLTECYGNPSAGYAIGRRAKKALELSRESIASCLHTDKREIFFTSGGSEADTWAILCAARVLKSKGKNHIITSRFEHHAVLHACAALEQEGFSVTYLDVHEDGLLRPEDLQAALRDTTGLVTLMYANNEIGTIQPIEKLGAICREKGVLFHTDAVQAAGHLPLDVKAQNIDMLSLSGHKFYGPKGIGALYVRETVQESLPLPSLILGGGQERGRRAGTENVAAAVGMAAALEEACEEMETAAPKIVAMREYLREGLLKIPGCRWNGDPIHRLPGNSSVSFPGIEGETLLLMLDMRGICVSSGSACTTGDPGPSHVLKAIGLSDQEAKGSLRISLGRQNTQAEAERLLEEITDIVTHLQKQTPFYHT